MQNTDKDDAPELTEADFARMRPIAEVDPALLTAHLNGTLKKRGRPKADIKKQVVSLRLDPDIIAAFRATGDGWQSRMNDVLRQHLSR